MARAKQTKKSRTASSRGRSRQGRDSRLADLLGELLSPTKGRKDTADLFALAAHMLPQINRVLGDVKFRRELTVGAISVFLELYAAVRDHRKRILDAEEKIQSLLRDVLRRFPADSRRSGE
jgi:hypothetical protein